MSVGEFESYRPEQVLLFEKIRDCNSNGAYDQYQSNPSRAVDGNQENQDNSDDNNSVSISMEDVSNEVNSRSSLNVVASQNVGSTSSSNENSKVDLQSKPQISNHSIDLVKRSDFLQIIKGAPHDSTVLPSVFFEPYTTEAKKEMGRWIDSLP